MNSNDDVNTQRAEVLVTLTQQQAEILSEELTSRRRHYAGQIGWLRGAGRDAERVELINRAECLDVLKAKIYSALMQSFAATSLKGEQSDTDS